jgi:Fe-S oxidoreductase
MIRLSIMLLERVGYDVSAAGGPAYCCGTAHDHQPRGASNMAARTVARFNEAAEKDDRPNLLLDWSFSQHSHLELDIKKAMAVFTDESKATEYADFHHGLSPRQFADKDDFLEYLRLLTGQYDQVTIDPKTNRLDTITPLGQLVELLEAAE